MTYCVYPTIDDLVNDVTEKPEGIENNLQARSTWDDTEEGDGGNFYGYGIKKVIDDIGNPNPKYAKLMYNTASVISTNEFLREKWKVRQRSCTGHRVDIPRFLSGDQRCWFSMVKSRSEAPAVRVFAPMGGICDITRTQMNVCGALSCAISEILEANGVLVEMWAACTSIGVMKTMGADNDMSTFIKIKSTDEYINYPLISYITGDSFFYRTTVFRSRIKAASRMNMSLFRNVGGSTSLRKEYIPEDPDYDPDLDIVVPRIYGIDHAKSYVERMFSPEGEMASKMTKRIETENEA